jgi:hypothetical protein
MTTASIERRRLRMPLRLAAAFGGVVVAATAVTVAVTRDGEEPRTPRPAEAVSTPTFDPSQDPLVVRFGQPEPQPVNDPLIVRYGQP